MLEAKAYRLERTRRGAARRRGGAAPAARGRLAAATPVDARAARGGPPARRRPQRTAHAPGQGAPRRRGRDRAATRGPRGPRAVMSVQRPPRIISTHGRTAYELEQLACSPGTYFNPQTEVLVDRRRLDLPRPGGLRHGATTRAPTGCASPTTCRSTRTAATSCSRTSRPTTTRRRRARSPRPPSRAGRRRADDEDDGPDPDPGPEDSSDDELCSRAVSRRRDHVAEEGRVEEQPDDHRGQGRSGRAGAASQ